MTETVKTIEKKVYVAEDGREFDKEKDCRKYEAEIKEKRYEIRPPYQFLADPTIARWVDEYLDVAKVTKVYSTTEIFAADIKTKEDAVRAKLLCQKYDGLQERWGDNFEVGKKYLICINTQYTMLKVESDVYVVSYEGLKNFYEKLANDIKSIF